MKSPNLLFMTLAFICMLPSVSAMAAKDIVHDGEYSFLKAQYAEKWAEADRSGRLSGRAREGCRR